MSLFTFILVRDMSTFPIKIFSGLQSKNMKLSKNKVIKDRASVRPTDYFVVPYLLSETDVSSKSRCFLV